MNRFLDTCVIIAYCFPTHSFNDRCLEIMLIRKIWISDNVLAEWKEKEREVVYDHNAALLNHIQYIQSIYEGSINEDKKNDLIAICPLELDRFMEVFYNQIDYPITIGELCEKLTAIALDLRDKAKRSYKELERRWALHSRMHEYPTEEQKLEKFAHEEDIWILIDAHDISLKISPNPLKFLTTDNGLWDNRTDILKIVNIYEIRDLKRESALD